MRIELDVTDVWASIKEARTFEIDIATWSDATGKVTGSNGGWTVSASLRVTPGTPPRNVLAVVPLFDGVATAAAPTQSSSFTLPVGTTSARLEYRATGHGGGTVDAACIGPADEFCQRQHALTLDSASLAAFQPWRVDCDQGCTLQRYSGVLGEFDYCAENPCGAPQSVRAPRANWCPGTVTQPFVASPDSLKTAGTHSFGFAIDQISQSGGSWRVTTAVYVYGQ